MIRITAALSALVLVAAPLVAQGHETHGSAQPPQQQTGMMGGRQMGGGEGAMGVLTRDFGRYAPAAVLGMKTHLSLTADQEARLTALAEEEKIAVADAHHPAHAAHMELRRLQAAETPDLEAMQRYFLAHHTAEGRMQWLRVSYAVKARALLTPTQRQHVDQMGSGAAHP